ncbi:glycosyltransferase family protein [uncultured Algoriphagus sp.]|uniref:glycosyltransferase family protein n=1 Tax=uncultured Algoriphagus sp. TaxID=417365 RepID=UPI00258F8165|nr:glycosyltransferase family protein [uncultured Algoriphagus sp.]
MRFLFIVQGEGRGHMTQAIAFSNLLRSQGHELAGVLVGKSHRRSIPDFFTREIQAPILALDSPNFEADGAEKKILLGKTIRKNLKKAPIFWKSLLQIDDRVKSLNPDIILNFYDLLGGLYSMLFRPKAAYWVIGHQYLSGHPEFLFAPGRNLERLLFRLNTQITAWGAEEILALSFLPQKMASRKVRVVPPLLRREVKKLSPHQGGFYLAYMVNPGYGQEVITYAKAHPHIQIKAYWDKKDAAEVEQVLPNLTLNRVHDQCFLQDMAACKGLICTAGFESVCEAMYLGKPILVIPVAGQYEQACNALEVIHSGIGKTANSFDFSILELASLEKTNPLQEDFQRWVETWEQVLMRLLPVPEQASIFVQSSDLSYT